MFTSIRELVENSLDATEAISVLPNISINIIEYSETEHNSMHGISTNKKGINCMLYSICVFLISLYDHLGTSNNNEVDAGVEVLEEPKEKSTKDKKNSGSKDQHRMYYKIVVSDNGCGMASKDIGVLIFLHMYTVIIVCLQVICWEECCLDRNMG